MKPFKSTEASSDSFKFSLTCQPTIKQQFLFTQNTDLLSTRLQSSKLTTVPIYSVTTSYKCYSVPFIDFEVHLSIVLNNVDSTSEIMDNKTLGNTQQSLDDLVKIFLDTSVFYILDIMNHEKTKDFIENVRGKLLLQNESRKKELFLLLQQVLGFESTFRSGYIQGLRYGKRKITSSMDLILLCIIQCLLRTCDLSSVDSILLDEKKRTLSDMSSHLMKIRNPTIKIKVDQLEGSFSYEKELDTLKTFLKALLQNDSDTDQVNIKEMLQSKSKYLEMFLPGVPFMTRNAICGQHECYGLILMVCSSSYFFTPEFLKLFHRKDIYPEKSIIFLNRMVKTIARLLTSFEELLDKMTEEFFKALDSHHSREKVNQKFLPDFENLLKDLKDSLRPVYEETDISEIVIEINTFINKLTVEDCKWKELFTRISHIVKLSVGLPPGNLTQTENKSQEEEKPQVWENSKNDVNLRATESDKNNEQIPTASLKTSFQEDADTERNNLYEIEELESLEDFALHKNCKKNYGHNNFITVEQLSKKKLPEGYQNKFLLNCIKAVSEITVKIIVSQVSLERPKLVRYSGKPYPQYDKRGRKLKRMGTGTVTAARPVDTDLECSCKKCKDQAVPNKAVGIVRVLTSRHVVFDQSEAKAAICILNYNSESAEVITLQAIDVDESDHGTDLCELSCVTCDNDLFIKLNNLSKESAFQWKNVHETFRFKKSNKILVFIVSHPHGLPKRISFGFLQGKQKCLSQHSIYYYDTPTCPGSSGALVNIVQQSPDKYHLYNRHVHSGCSVSGPNQSALGSEYLYLFYFMKAAIETILTLNL